MTKENQIKLLKGRLSKVESRPDAHKTPGIIRKIKRQIRNLEK